MLSAVASRRSEATASAASRARPEGSSRRNHQYLEEVTVVGCGKFAGRRVEAPSLPRRL